MNDKKQFIRLTIGYLLIGLVINLLSIMISPYITVFLDGLVIYFVYLMSLRWFRNHIMWTGLILGISFLVSGLSTVFLIILCVIKQSSLLCNRNPMIIGGLPFYLGATLWTILSVVKMAKKIKTYIQ